MQIADTSLISYLGISIGERMPFALHVEALRQKIADVVGSLRRVLKKSWGIKCRTVRILFRGLFESRLMLGASAWYEVRYMRRASMPTRLHRGNAGLNG